MKKLTGIAWFTNQRGTVGIATIVDEFGVKHGRISTVKGLNEDEDALFVARNGARIHWEIAHDIVEEYGVPKKVGFEL